MASKGKIFFAGHYAEDQAKFDGQTLRTRLLRNELFNRLPTHVIQCLDTARPSPSKVLALLVGLVRCQDALVLPNSRGILFLMPVYALAALLRITRVHFLVVGGWLPDFLRSRPVLQWFVRQCSSVHVQTERMRNELARMNISAHLMVNFRYFEQVHPPKIYSGTGLRLVFLSRIMPEKGLDLAVDAVSELFKEGKDVSLDIYGPVEEHNAIWFSALAKRHPENIRAHGPVAHEAVIDTLSQYDAMIFPTYYEGEAFPGVVVEAFSAALPVIASDWQDNPEVVEDEKTGLIFETGNKEALIAAIERCQNDKAFLSELSHAAATKAVAYHVDVVLPEFLASIGLSDPHSEEKVLVA